MEAQLQPAASFQAQEYSQSFFREVPTDSRFIQCSYKKIAPSTSVEADIIVFDLQKFDAGNIYQIQNACLEVVCKITKADGKSLPDTGKTVFPVNNTLHSLFSVVRLSINDVPIIKQPDYYPYKAYIANLLSYSNELKNGQLATQGFYSELSGHWNTDDAVNAGYVSRRKLFRKNFEYYLSTD